MEAALKKGLGRKLPFPAGILWLGHSRDLLTQKGLAKPVRATGPIDQQTNSCIWMVEKQSNWAMVRRSSGWKNCFGQSSLQPSGQPIFVWLPKALAFHGWGAISVRGTAAENNKWPKGSPGTGNAATDPLSAGPTWCFRRWLSLWSNTKGRTKRHRKLSKERHGMGGNRKLTLLLLQGQLDVAEVKF